MTYKKLVFILCFLLWNNISFGQKLTSSERYGYQLMLPDDLKLQGGSEADSDKTFVDEVSGIVMVITARDGIYPDTRNYMDCSMNDLEKKLQQYQGDSTLRLLSCSRSRYYADSSVILHFETSVLPAGLNRCIIYFVHHNKKEIQFSFMYDKKEEKNDLEYVDSVMRSLRLF